MAYINAEKVAEIRKNLKAKFPKFKFSVRKDGFISLNVTILSGPVRFAKDDYSQINHFHTHHYQNEDILREIIATCNDGNYDNSDIQTDYFDVGWYFHLSQGKWDRPYVQTEG